METSASLFILSVIVGSRVIKRPCFSEKTAHSSLKTTRPSSGGNTEDRVCIVTGSSRGIGASIAESLALDGYKVVVNYRDNDAKANEILLKIFSNGGKAIAVKGDVSNRQDVARMFDLAEKKFGTVTACVNNAAVIGMSYTLSPIV